MVETLYQNWYFHRPELAERILSLLLDGPGDPVALVGDRRIGKTSHLLYDLIPAARKRGFLPVYADIYQNRDAPLAAINYALQEAVDDIEVPSSKAGKRLKTSVTKIGMAGATVDFGEEPTRRRPEDPLLLVDWLLKTLVRLAKKPVLLVFDEIQELARLPGGESSVSAVRSAITKSKNYVRVVFTGSSQEKLLELFARSRAALYEGASTLAFPYLGEDFLEFIARKSKERFKKRIAPGELKQAFERLHHQPRALIDLVLLFASSEATSLIAALDDRVESQLTGTPYDVLWASMKPLHKRICVRIVRGEDVTSSAARQEYAVGTGRKEIAPGTVSGVLRAMVASHILSKPGGSRARYRIDDPLFAEWIRRATSQR
ncbi:MAG: hypothetical protein ACKVQA_16175 [Burkholderiales bacterium]